MKKIIRLAILFLLSTLVVSPLHAQLEGTGIVVTDPGINRINWAAAERGSVITDIPKASSGSSAASVLVDGVRQGGSVYVGLSESVDMVIDFGDTHIVDTVQLNFFESNNNHFRYQILGSVNGTDYEMLIDKSTGEHFGKQVDTFEPASLRYIKILPVSSSRSDNLIFLQDEILVLGSVVVTPTEPQTLVIDSVEDGGGGNEDGQMLTLHSGIYHVEFNAGAASPWTDDSSNSGKTWDTRLEVYVKGTNKTYEFGFIHNFLSRFATPTEAEDASRDHSFMIHVPFETSAYFKYPVSNPANARGSQTYKLTQVSGPNESRLVQVRDAILRSIIWQEKEVASWQSWLTTGNRNCFGCHVQTQTSVGINETKARLTDLPYNKRLEEEFVEAYPRWQNSSGWVSPFHNGSYKVTQTSLWAWAVSTFRGENFDTLLPSLVKAVDYLRGTQQGNGGWNADHNSADSAKIYSDGTPSATHTTGNIQALMKVVSELRDDTIVPFTSATIAGGQIELESNEGNIHEIEVDAVEEVTAVRLTITDSFDTAAGGFVLNEFEAFNLVAKHVVSSSDSSTSDPSALVDESHDGESSDINNGWGNGSEDVRNTNASAIWVFQEPVRIDRIVLSQIFPDKQLKDYTLEYTTGVMPTLSSSFTEFSITGAGTASEAAVAPYIDSVRNAATLYTSDSWNYARNVRTAAQTIIGLYVALPVLDGELAEAALSRIVEVQELLRDAQLPAGGWSTSTGGTGSPLAYQSAQAMYALLLVADEDLDEDLLRGVDYLINTQRVDGSWTFPGLSRRLASTTWVEIALPLIFEKLNEQFSRDTITDVQATGLLNAVEVSWSPVEGATGYNIYRRSVDGSFQLIAENHQSDIASFLDSDVQVETTYIYMVRWLNGAGSESADSNEDSGTPSGLVCGGDAPPDIVSDPVVEGLVGHSYRYQVEATDRDEGDVLTYSLPAAPEGMDIDSTTGLITWTPASDQLGSHFVRVWVTDKIGRYATQAYRVTAARVFVNEAPEFKSQPVKQAVAGYQYVYKAKAVDPNIGDVLTYEKVSGPGGMVINDTTGRVRWTPSSADVGPGHAVSLAVTDANNLSDSQTYEIEVVANQKPTISSSPITQGIRGLSYFYQVEATDPEGGQLLYALTGAPDGMRIHRATGRITWSPDLNTIGDFPVTVVVTDEGGLTDTQSYVLNVPDNTPPLFQSEPLTAGAVGYSYSYDSDATDVETPDLRYELTSGPSGMKIDVDSGLVTWQPSAAGTFSVVLSVFDGEGLKDEQAYDVAVTTTGSNLPNMNDGQPGGTFPPGAPDGNVLSPAPFSVIKETTPVQISVSDPDLADGVEVEWSVELRREGDSEGITLGSGTGPEVNTTAGTIEPSTLADDMYRIYLHLTYGSTTYSKWFPYEIKTRVKLGVYQTSVTDLEIPLAGMPISIIRDYTSADTKKYQFGHGWRLRYPGRVVDSASESPLSAYSAGTRVFVTLPDGQRVGFTFEPYAQSFLFSFLQTPYFRPDPGVFATLEVDQESVTPSGGSYYHFLGGAYNPSKFYLTTRDRIRYTIVEGKGITEIRDANFNSLTFTDNAITHSSGEAIQVQRDGNGNITKLSAPGGAVMNYFYNGNGDLTSFKDLAGGTWKYTYDASHRLKTLIDPSGNQIIENFYTSEGQLYRQLDANGEEIKISIPSGENVEIVTDQNGNSSRREYDSVGNLIKTIDAEGGVHSYAYDDNYNLISQIDPNGNSYAWSYDSKGNLSKEVDSLGRETVVESFNNLSQPTRIRYDDGSVYTRQYDARGNLLSASDANGRSTTATYDTAGRLLTLTDPGGATSTLEYNSLGQVYKTLNEKGHEKIISYNDRGRVSKVETTRTDNNGVEHRVAYSYQYDAQGRPIAVTDPNGYTAYVEWTALNKPAKFTDKRGYVFTYDYDKLGNLTQINYPDGALEKIEYDSTYNRNFRKDREGNEVRFEFDKRRRKTKTIFPDGSSEQYEYDSNGNMTKRIDGEGHETLYRYDEGNRNREIEDALGNVTRFNYDIFNNQNEFVNSLGQITKMTFNSDAKVLQQIQPNSTISTYQYDAVGNMISEVDPDGFEIKYEYDDLGRKIKSIDATGHATTYTYDEVGNLLKVTDPLGAITKWDYDNLGNVVREELPTGEVSKWEYDGNGNKVSEELPLTGKTVHEYDFNNWKVKSTDASGKITLLGYDKNGNLASVTDPNNNKTTYRYDSKGRLKEKEDAAGKLTIYTYDKNDNIREIVDRNNRIKRFEYDEINRVVKEEWVEGNSVVRTKQYSYDDGNNIVKAWDELATYEYDYDDNNQRISTKVTESNVLPGVTRERTYNNRGLVTSIVDSDGSIVATEYDENGQIVKRSLNGGSLSASSFTFGYDDAGNRVEQQGYLSLDDSQKWSSIDTEPDARGRAKNRTFNDSSDVVLVDEAYVYSPTGLLKEIDRDGNVFSYDYDESGQIVSASYSGYPDDTFDYDNNGNRKNSGFVPGALNRLLEDDVYTYQYDDEGNVVRRDHKSNGTYEEFSYNHENAVEEVLRKTLATDDVILTVEYEYDLYGNRISRSVNGQKEVYLPEGVNVWSDYTSSGVKKRHYLFGPEVDEILASHTPNGNRQGYLIGHMNTVIGSYSENGQLESELSYTAFGRQLSGSGIASRYRFNGREYDEELGLYYNRARMYDPHSGRFLSEDPLGVAAGDTNFYRYGFNSPTNFSDPTGLTFVEDVAVRSSIPAPIAASAAANTGVYSTEVVIALEGVATAAESVTVATELAQAQAYFYAASAGEGAALQLTKVITVRAFALMAVILALPQDEEVLPDGTVIERASLSLSPTDEYSQEAVAERVRRRRQECDKENPQPLFPKDDLFRNHYPPLCNQKGKSCFTNPLTADTDTKTAWSSGWPLPGRQKRKKFCFPVQKGISVNGEREYCIVAVVDKNCFYHGFPETREYRPSRN